MPDHDRLAAPPGLSAQAADGRLRDTAERWPVERSEQLAAGSIIEMRQDAVRMPDGDTANREYIRHPGAVAVLALDDRDRVLLVRQYRHPPGWKLWELPAGLRDVTGEPLLTTGQRELAEETGYRAADWRVLLDVFTSPGCSNERLRIYLARGLSEIPAAERSYVREHEEADLELGWLDLDEAAARFLGGEFHNGVTAVGILAAYAARPGGFAALRAAGAPDF